jgi:hypothetical protein
MIGRLDTEDVQVTDEQAAEIFPGARLCWLDAPRVTRQFI